MSKEKIPEKFPARVARSKGFIENWEETIEDEHDAKLMFESFDRHLQTLGIDIRNGKVLELGSGNSMFLNYLKKQAINAVGLDVRPRGETEGLPISVARVEQLPFPNETFNTILAISVFDHSV